jgi:hypothetical protein
MNGVTGTRTESGTSYCSHHWAVLSVLKSFPIATTRSRDLILVNVSFDEPGIDPGHLESVLVTSDIHLSEPLG